MTDQTPEARMAAALHDSIRPVCVHNNGRSCQAASAILAADPTLVCPDPDAHEPASDQQVTFTVDSLAAAMGKAWPGHIEGSGRSGTQYTVPPPETKYWVKDLCLPSEHLAAAILKAAKEASE